MIGISILLSACACTLIAALTKKDMAVFCSIAYWFCFFFVNAYPQESIETYMVAGSLCDFGILCAAASMPDKKHERLSLSIMSICVASLISNGLNLVQSGQYLVYIGYALQAATVISLSIFDGRRELIIDFFHGVGAAFHSLSNAARRINHWR